MNWPGNSLVHKQEAIPVHTQVTDSALTYQSLPRPEQGLGVPQWFWQVTERKTAGTQTNTTALLHLCVKL